MTKASALLASMWMCGCHGPDSNAEAVQSRLSQAQAVEIGLGAIEADMSLTYAEKYKPYRAEFRDGSWHVFGTVPGNGPGGTPEAIVLDGDGKVLSVGHSQ